MNTKSLIFLVLMCLTPSLWAQNTIIVPGDQPTIQAGIDAASDGDIVLVDQGLYYENINFKGKAITVRSHYDPLNPDSAHILNTIIDGSQAANPDSASVVYFINDEDTLSVIHGFTIQGGKGTKDIGFRAGGGISCFQAGPKIEYNRIIDNECRDVGGTALGGGIDIWDSHSSIPVIRHNKISNNACYKLVNGDGNLFGGGISVVSTNAGYECRIENNIISNNKCSNEVQDQNVNGGGIFLQKVKATIINNQIIGNQSNSTDDYWVNFGAGICAQSIMDGSNISGNLIADNSFNSPWSAGAGLGIMKNSGKVIVDRNTFSNDTARRGGAVVLIEIESEVDFTNNVLKGNHATYRGGGIYIWHNSTKSLGYPEAARGINIIDISGEKNKDVGVAVIANNTFIENSDLYGTAASIHLRDITVPLIAFNNIFYNLEGGSGREIFISESGATAYLFNNLLDTVNHILSYGDWSGSDNIVSDPLFLDTLCHLNICESPCINKGIDALDVDGIMYYSPIIDFDNEVRPYLNTLPDIGADETPCLNDFIENNQDSKPFTINVSSYPNPFSLSMTIEYELFKSSTADITIFNHLGQIVESFSQGNSQPGIHQYVWNASGMPAGIYFVQVKAGNESGMRKVIKH